MSTDYQVRRVRHLTPQSGASLDNIEPNYGAQVLPDVKPELQRVAAETIAKERKVERAMQLHVGYEVDANGLRVTLPEHLTTDELNEHIELLTSQREQMSESNRVARTEAREGWQAGRKEALAQIRALQQSVKPLLETCEALRTSATFRLKTELENLWGNINTAMFDASLTTAMYPAPPASLDLAIKELTEERNRRLHRKAARADELRAELQALGISV